MVAYRPRGWGARSEAILDGPPRSRDESREQRGGSVNPFQLSERLSLVSELISLAPQRHLGEFDGVADPRRRAPRASDLLFLHLRQHCLYT